MELEEREMKRTAADAFNCIEPFPVEDAIIIYGAIAVYPTNQGGARSGWILMPDKDCAQINGIVPRELSARELADFLSENGKCRSGDPDFNNWVNANSRVDEEI